MFTRTRIASVAVLFGITAAICNAQSVVSAHSGTLHYFDGAVAIDGEPVVGKVGKFTEIKPNSVLHVAQGRAEVLLTPGVFLRVGENSEIKMLDNRLLSTRVEIVSGSVMVESDDPQISVKDQPVTLIYGKYEIQPVKYGVFEITSEPSVLKVFKGQASVASIASSTTASKVIVKEGKLLPFNEALVTESFDARQGDDLLLWTRDRSSALSAANMSSARGIANNCFASTNCGGYGPYGTGNYDASMTGRGGWYYNQYLNMFTYVPYGGTFWSPFGYGFYSPYSIYSYYNPNGYYWNGGGARSGGVPLTNIGTSSVAASQVSRIGNGATVHPTLGSPIRTSAGSLTNSSATYRGGFQGGGQGGGFQGGGNNGNPGFSSAGIGASDGGSIGRVSAGVPSGGGAAASGGRVGAVSSGAARGR